MGVLTCHWFDGLVLGPRLLMRSTAPTIVATIAPPTIKSPKGFEGCVADAAVAAMYAV